MAPTERPPTEKDIHLLAFIALGYTNREIAEAMGVTEDTVKTRAKLLWPKIGAKNRSHGVYIAVREGWLEPDWDAGYATVEYIVVPEAIEAQYQREGHPADDAQEPDAQEEGGGC